MGLFLPIFLYEIFEFELKYVLFYYIARFGIYGLTVALGAQYLNKIGLKRSLRLSMIFIFAFYGVLYYIDRIYQESESLISEHPLELLILMSIATMLIILRSIMYWIPFHTDFSKFTNKNNRAKQISLLSISETTIKTGAPLVAGWILTAYNYDILFLIVIFISISSAIPLAKLPRTRERFVWSYSKTWREFLSKERRDTILAYMGDGAEKAIGLIIWPIFMWKVLEGDYLKLGIISSAVVAVTIILQLLIGNLTDKAKDRKDKMLEYGSIFYSIGWIIKIFVATAFHVFATSIYHSISKIFYRTPFDTLTYEKAAEQGHLVDEYTVLHEMAATFGKTIMLTAVLFATFFVGIEYTFMFAAIAALSLNLLTKVHT